MMIRKFISGSLRLASTLVAAFMCSASAAPAQVPDALLDMANPRVQEVIKVQESVTTDLMGLEGILGTAVGEDGEGGLAMVVYVDQDNANRGEIMRALPHGNRGVRVISQLTDKFEAFGKPTAGAVTSVSHKQIQTPPIQLGTSG